MLELKQGKGNLGSRILKCGVCKGRDFGTAYCTCICDGFGKEYNLAQSPSCSLLFLFTLAVPAILILFNLNPLFNTRPPFSPPPLPLLLSHNPDPLRPNTSTLAPTLKQPTPTPINRTRNCIPLAPARRARPLRHTVLVAHPGPVATAGFLVAHGVPAELGGARVEGGVGVGVGDSRWGGVGDGGCGGGDADSGEEEGGEVCEVHVG